MSFGVVKEVVEGLKGWFDDYREAERRAREVWMKIERNVEGERGGWEMEVGCGRLWRRPS